MSNSSSPSERDNVGDAVSYLDAVKGQCQDQPELYDEFLDIMKDFKNGLVDPLGVIHSITRLFAGNHVLLRGFNNFLPAGYRINVPDNPLDNVITVTTPFFSEPQPSAANAKVELSQE